MYLEYEKERECIFFFGAGASYSDGVPLQRDIVPQILYPNDKELQNSNLRKLVVTFLNRNFSHSKEKNIYPSLETIFSYLDYFLENEVALSKEYTLNKLNEIKESLIKLIYYITSKSIKIPLSRWEREEYGKENDSVYSYFWERTINTNRNFSIITTNYDNQIDDAFDKWMYPKYGIIDYCIDFMNYTKEQDLIGFDWWINPREPIPDWPDCKPKPIKLIKLHGSLNWKYCQCCGQTLLTPWNKYINIQTGALPRFAPSFGNKEDESYFYCPRDGHPFSTMIVPPTHRKTLKHPVIQQLFYEAQKEIRVSKKVVFVGYSFPEADIHIKAIFKKNLRDTAKIIVINPSLSEESKETYRGISKNIEFIEKDFLSVIQDGFIESVIGNTA